MDENDLTSLVKCPYCGENHPNVICHRIKAIEYQGREITRVEFFAPLDYPQQKPEEPEQDYPRLPRSR